MSLAEAQRIDNLNKALFSAVLSGHVVDVEKFINDGADIHYKGNRAIKYAASHDRHEIVKLLLDHGADQNKLTHRYNTAADIARAHGHNEMENFIRNY